MRIREYQLDKIEEARRIQQECLRLHMPCPPVLHWNYDIKDKRGETVEIGRGKANSFTRNALNLLAHNIGFCSNSIFSASLFGDGLINVKDTAGNIRTSSGVFCKMYSSTPTFVYLGTGTDEESLDSYSITNTASLTEISRSAVSAFDLSSRKLVTTITASKINDTASEIILTEAGLYFNVYYTSSSQSQCLLVRDVLTPITVAAGETINWTYTTEVAYPNP